MQQPAARSPTASGGTTPPPRAWSRTATTILPEAMRDARDELTRRISVSPTKWTWGQLHRLDLENQTLGQSGIGLVGALQPRPATRSAAAARSSTRPAGTPPTGTTSTRRPRCGWSSTSPTSTARAGSTSPASPATSSPATTTTRPRCGSTARPCPGPSGGTRSPGDRGPAGARAVRARLSVASGRAMRVHLRSPLERTSRARYPSTAWSAPATAGHPRGRPGRRLCVIRIVASSPFVDASSALRTG